MRRGGRNSGYAGRGEPEDGMGHFVVLAPAGESAMFEAKLVVYYQSRLLAMRIHRLSRCQLYFTRVFASFVADG